MQINVYFQIFILVFSVIIHEVSHGFTAFSFGDKTPEYDRRLTLNPIAHIDIWGSLFVPFVLYTIGAPMIGWAKPVQYNPYNLKHRRIAEPLVALAGPASNFLLAFVFGNITRVLIATPEYAHSNLIEIFSFVTIVNISLAIFNLIPIPPLDGSKVIFSFLPVGSKFIFSSFAHRYGLMIIFAIIIFAPRILSPMVFSIFSFMTGIR